MNKEVVKINNPETFINALELAEYASIGTAEEFREYKATGLSPREINKTDECISAVAEHMKHKADFNKDSKGFWQYTWPGFGKLTWESEGGT